jgi:hypothetical protein
VLRSLNAEKLLSSFTTGRLISIFYSSRELVKLVRPKGVFFGSRYITMQLFRIYASMIVVLMSFLPFLD